jgi:hypothetical protein
MNRKMMMMAAIVLAVATAAGAQEPSIEGRWSMTFSAGAALPGGGEFHEGGRGTVLGLPTTVAAKSTRDVFDPGVGWRAGLGYGVTRRVELFGEFGWTRAEASELSVGDVATLDLRAAFGDYTSWGANGGMRFHMTPGARVNPYVAALAGIWRVDAIPGTFSVPAAGVTLADTPFFDTSIVPVFGGDVGVLFGVSPRVSLGIEGGLRYHSDLSQIEGLAGTGLENLNDAGSGWSVPVSAVVRVGF